MAEKRQWGSNEHGTPKLWYAPTVALLTLLAPLMVSVLVRGNVSWNIFAGALAFAVVYGTGLELNRQRLIRRRIPRDDHW